MFAIDKSNWTLFFVLCLTLLLFSCNADKEQQQALFNEVMEVHDEVMPKMGNLRSLAIELSARADTLAQDSTIDQGVRIEEMRNLAKNLKDANEGMMEWMRQFEQVEDGTPHGEVIQYLTEQRKQIQQVKDDMLNARDAAEEYLLKND